MQFVDEAGIDVGRGGMCAADEADVFTGLFLEGCDFIEAMDEPGDGSCSRCDDA